MWMNAIINITTWSYKKSKQLLTDTPGEVLSIEVEKVRIVWTRKHQNYLFLQSSFLKAKYIKFTQPSFSFYFQSPPLLIFWFDQNFKVYSIQGEVWSMKKTVKLLFSCDLEHYPHSFIWIFNYIFLNNKVFFSPSSFNVL